MEKLRGMGRWSYLLGMARRTRDFKPGVAMHVWQRANHQEAILLDDLDFVCFLRLLQGHCEENRVRVCGYCVMTNHYHVVTVAEARESLSRAIGPGLFGLAAPDDWKSGAIVAGPVRILRAGRGAFLGDALLRGAKSC